MFYGILEISKTFHKKFWGQMHIAECLERLAANANVFNGPRFNSRSDTFEFERQQMK